MIPIPEAEASYQRVIHLEAKLEDSALLIEAAQQEAMPAHIVELGNAINESATAAKTYHTDPSLDHLEAWTTADTVLRGIMSAIQV